ncbi:MAG: hypothetical protein LBS60_09850 [Deltaproteobacteria bacterium]|jgi:hypothetical protein|nr:hypothetical protein [Deltaproteobacteria bacterium]
MTKFGSRGQKILKFIHLVMVCLWTGGAVALNLMILLLGPATSGEELYGYNMAAILVDDAVLIPGAMGCLITGILISGLTPWGFFKHKWVTIKYILTVFCILFGTFVLGPTVNDQPQITKEFGLSAISNSTYMANWLNSVLGGIFQMLAFMFMILISILKPWRKSGSAKDAAA